MGFNLVKMARRRLQKSIQARLFTMLFLLGVMSLSALVIISIWLGRSEIQSEVSRRNQEVATLVSSQLDNHLEEIVTGLQLQAQTLSEGWKNSIPILRFVQQAAVNGYQSIALVDKDGLRYLGFNANMEDLAHNVQPSVSSIIRTPADLSGDPAYLNTKDGDNYVSPLMVLPPGNQPVVTIGIPVKTDAGLFNGTLIVGINMKRLLDTVSAATLNDATVINVLDSADRVVASTDRNMVGKVLVYSEIIRSDRPQTGYISHQDNQGREYLVGFATIRNYEGWKVTTSRSMDEATAGINRLAYIAGGLAAFLVVITCLVGILVSKSITRPVRELAVAANRITTTGNLDAQIPITTQDEVGELTASFNGMILALRKTRMALEHWNRELEHKVEVRTQQQALANSQLEQTNVQLERANLHKSQFLANMSHELRTPLNAIIGFSEVLQDQVFGELNEKQYRYVNNILSSGRHLLNLVNDVLDLSKVEAGKMELHWEEFSCNAAIYEVQTQLSTLAGQKDLQVQFEASQEIDRILADRARFRQILFNLLSNAIKFTPQGGQISIVGRLEKSLRADGTSQAQAVFSFRDTGIGISRENLEGIFESFRQVDNSYSRQYQGTGLGLALTRKLVEMHGGAIWVESEPGIGSTFSFTIPLVSSLLNTNLIGAGSADAGGDTTLPPKASRKNSL